LRWGVGESLTADGKGEAVALAERIAAMPNHAHIERILEPWCEERCKQGAG
jgi:hypothetical protein